MPEIRPSWTFSTRYREIKNSTSIRAADSTIREQPAQNQEVSPACIKAENVLIACGTVQFAPSTSWAPDRGRGLRALIPRFAENQLQRHLMASAIEGYADRVAGLVLVH